MTAAADAADVRVHELFERQADRTPNATAAVCGSERLTYAELDERANQLAHCLLKAGAGNEELVGIAMNRSIAMMVALLGTWKAGCAYVPLDPAYPRERLAFMLENAGLRRIVVDEAAREAIGAAVDERPAALIALDTESSPVWRESAERPGVSGETGDLAYVMFTSGSTGRPKGAMITHAGLANYLEWAVAAYGVQAGGSVPVHSSLSFDLTVTSLYVPLLTGAHVDLLDDDGPLALVAALRAKRRSLVKITPAHLDVLSHALAPDELAGMVGTLVVGGEQLLAESLAMWRRHAPATRLINEYGPTETVVGCCIHEVQAADPSAGPVPIGRPIANTSLHVLDQAQRPVPEGDVGELYVGGPGVARGYWEQAELTEQRFVPDRFSGTPGARLYRTGDLVRIRKAGDGVLEYLGRIDDQVKVRGHRVELGEIEQTLAAHPAVRSCAAIVHEGAAGGPRLLAFAALRQMPSAGDEDLAAFLRDRLPRFMMPARVLVIEAMPLTVNGKVDRAALRRRAEPPVHCGPPLLARTPTERQVLAAFEEVFQRRDFGISDNFFDLGGHSLAAVRLMTLLRASTGINVPLRNLYEHPTVVGMARAIEALRWASDAHSQRGSGHGERTQASF